MIGSVGITGTNTPQRGRKDEDRQQKKAAHDLQPKSVADAAEGAQKSSHAARQSAAGLPSGLTRRAAGRQTGSGMGCGLGGLANDAAGDAHPNAQYASDGLRFHSVYDGSSDDGAAARQRKLRRELPESRIGRKVEETMWQSARHLARAAVSEVPVKPELRELIEQLGEAIHESVIESEQISGVVQEIRQQGFDVLLMLEATIGLNQTVTSEPGTDGAADGEQDPSGEAPFSQNDLHFLRSLRISVEGEEDQEPPSADA